MQYHFSNEQMQIINYNNGPLLVYGSPGSGKTQVMIQRTRRLVREDKGNHNVLILTFNKANILYIENQLYNLEGNGYKEKLTVDTIYGFCLDIIKNRGEAIGLSKDITVLSHFSDRLNIIKEIFETYLHIENIKRLNEIQDMKAFFNRIINFISNQKVALKPPELIEWYELDERASEEQIFQFFYAEYNNLLSSKDLIDIDDIVFLTYRILAERPSLKSLYQKLYKYIMVDEAQDLTNASYNLIKLLGDGHKNLMLLGEQGSSIYQFVGSSEKYLKEFEIHFKPLTVHLKSNYRSAESIVNLINKLKNDKAFSEQIYPIKGEVNSFRFEDEENEAEWIVNNIIDILSNGHKEVQKEINFDDIAILARTRYSLKCIEQKLEEARIPYYKHLPNLFDSESTFMRCFETGIRLIINPNDILTIQKLSKLIFDKRDDNDFLKRDYTSGLELLNDLYHHVEGKWKEYFPVLLQAWGHINERPVQFISSLEILEKYVTGSYEHFNDEIYLISNDLTFWRESWKTYIQGLNGREPNLSAFRNNLLLRRKKNKNKKGVALHSIHSSKGLEFDIVYVISMVEGSFPISSNRNVIKEEENLLYVAISRAKRVLYFTYSSCGKLPNGKIIRQKPSRFLEILNLL